MKKSWFYNFVFLLLEMLQALIGVVTLTLWRPILTYHFARWNYNRRSRATFLWRE